jgi:TonB-linked SusC/RagA family outer membrane protein
LVAALLAGIGLSPGLLSAQSTGQVTGTVTSATGTPMAGVRVGVSGTTLGATTGADGRFSISGVSAGNHTLRATLVGYAEATRAVNVVAGQTATVDIQLSAQAISLEGVVAVGYGTQKKATLTGSVAAVSGEEIAASPAANVSNSLAGKLPGVVTVNTSGEPGYDGSSIRIRGNHTLNDNSPLVVIDGVADRSGGLERLNPQDIASISVLKDASAAIYGARAANGVILVTTKRGTSGAPQLSVNVNQGFNQPTRLPEMADAVTYMTMLNEIDLYRDREPTFSQEEIDHYRNGDDPWLYPNTDWFDAVIKPMSLQRRGDVSLRGGADRIKYYLSLGGQTQDGYYENSATRYNQYSFRSNLDGQASKDLNIRFDVTGRIEDRNFPNRSAGSIFRAIMRGKPNLPAYWPNGLPGPDIEYGDNPVVIGTPATGFDRDQRYYVQGNLGADFTVPWVNGLTLRANAAYDQMFRYQKQWRTPWTLYTWPDQARDANGQPILVPGQRGYSAPELNQTDYRDNDILLNFIAEYRRDFGDHTVGILGGVERQTSDDSRLNAFRKYFISDQIDEIFAGGDPEKNNDGTAGLARRQNYFTRLNYDYADKYLLEFVGRYDGSYIFPEDSRFGFFPAVSAGWRISEEPFFQNNISVVNSLKLRGSWGQTGNDRINQWQYLASYGFGGGYVFGGQEVKSIYQTRTPNPNVTWEVANQMDFGVDGEAFDSRLSFTLDWFRENRDNILWYRNASVPQSTGLSLPRENIGKVNSWGYDGSLSWRQELGSQATFDVTLNGGYAQNKITFWDEAKGAPDYQKSTGYKMNLNSDGNDVGLYYRSLGVFKDQAAVDAYPHWSGARPGDIIFEDVNGDGEIDGDDRIRVNSNGDPTWTGGVTFGLNVQNFDATVFFQGAAGAVQYLSTESGEIGNYLEEFAEGRWTPDNPSSTKPRAFNRGEEYWIANRNTYFLRSTDYVRLKTVELGYRLPTSLASRIGVKSPRIYVSGFNVLTWDKFGLMDPESRNQSGQYYPQARVFNVGASVSF